MDNREFEKVVKEAVAEYANELLYRSDGKKITEADGLYRLVLQDAPEQQGSRQHDSA